MNTARYEREKMRQLFLPLSREKRWHLVTGRHPPTAGLPRGGTLALLTFVTQFSDLRCESAFSRTKFPRSILCMKPPGERGYRFSSSAGRVVFSKQARIAVSREILSRAAFRPSNNVLK
jgi:hypothetical protein